MLHNKITHTNTQTHKHRKAAVASRATHESAARNTHLHALLLLQRQKGVHSFLEKIAQMVTAHRILAEDLYTMMRQTSEENRDAKSRE